MFYRWKTPILPECFLEILKGHGTLKKSMSQMKQRMGVTITIGLMFGNLLLVRWDRPNFEKSSRATLCNFIAVDVKNSARTGSC